MRPFNQWNSTKRMVTCLKCKFTRNYLVQIKTRGQQWWNCKQGCKELQTMTMLHTSLDDGYEGFWA